ncbi:hypothetical protein DSO57_1032328 [Entomophthora muscae]|uniref:Uncharacterized protein n=1 Tax=Entomophthora muscae TaxID=34485 RepID=A0ACC2SDT1_9FUNG|nr:hypothetical protein DSO57_1032328 [Entomophthora muscae]
MEAFAEEITGFFYLYQLMIMWLFYYLAYWIIGVVDTVVIIASAIVKVMVRLRAEHRVKAMAEHQETVRVLRNGKWSRKSSRKLVPGDVFEVSNHSIVPCDAVLLQGCAVADESSLTGEPLPIRKFPLKPELVPFDRMGADKIHSLFAGTTIKQTMGEEVRALVCLTATDTDKGQLVHKILFPNPISFIFNEQLKVVVMILAVWGMVLFCMGMWLMKKGGSAAWFYGMLCLAQILSPILPASLVVGQSVAAKELEKRQVHCVDLPRIMIAGKVQIFCFDKTGTLTKEGLEFYGGQPVVDNRLASLEKTGFSDLFQLAISTCHSVTLVGGELIGNPVDIEMFTSTKWKLQTPQIPEYIDTIEGPNRVAHILRRFEFVHARASMSVAVLDEITGHVHVFIKGSFEKMGALAANLPNDYNTATTRLAAEGCYVLAVAHRDLGIVTKQQVDAMTREEMEGNADLLGLVVFKNQLKDDTRASILELKRGSTRTVMITGDTALTGIYIARASGMMSESSRVYLGDLGSDGEVFWMDAKNATAGKEEPLLSTSAVRGLFPRDGVGSIVELAVTGRAFNRLIETEEVRDLLLNVRVFARMLPQDKVHCIQLHMERGVTAMCGDGGNDCGALRAAHVGIALSEAEASIVAAFSSSNRSVSSCVELLRQGRAALATSFANYKFLILYGETMAFLKLHTFYFSISPSQNLWILVDAFITVGLTFALTQSQAADRLSSTRPTARILGPETLASALGQIFINAAFLMGAFGILFKQPFFKCHEFDASAVDLSKWYLLGDNFESMLLSFLVLFHFVNSAFVFNLGYKFRSAFYRNYLLIFIWGSFIILIMYVLLADPNWVGCALRLNCGDPDVIESLGYPRPTFDIIKYNIPHGHNVFPTSFRYFLAGYCIANMVAGILWETLVVLGPVRNWAKKNRPLPRLSVKL